MAKKKKKKTKTKEIKEVFTVHPEQGAVAELLGISKSGYKVKNIVRKGTKCTVTYEKEDKG